MRVRLRGAAVALLAAGCATHQNYLDPLGPRFEGAYAISAAHERELRVVTYNIKFGRKAAEAALALRTHPSLRNPDILVLQEMEAGGVELMARELGLNYVYFPASHDPKNGRDMGNAILSPWPIEESWKVLLPHPARVNHRARAAVAARLCVDGLALRVYSVHLGSPLGIGGGARREQAETVIRDAQASAEPVVLAGDFNSHGVGQAFAAAGFSWPTERVGRSAGLFSFDHVFLRGLATRRPPTAGVERAADKASDHRPVWVVLPFE